MCLGPRGGQQPGAFGLSGGLHPAGYSELAQDVGDVHAGRYGPYWVLTFELATAPLVVLVDELSILPDRHGGSAPLPAPAAPVDGRRRLPGPARP
jgi:hypothetical protein